MRVRSLIGLLKIRFLRHSRPCILVGFRIVKSLRRGGALLAYIFMCQVKLNTKNCERAVSDLAPDTIRYNLPGKGGVVVRDFEFLHVSKC